MLSENIHQCILKFDMKKRRKGGNENSYSKIYDLGGQGA
jgi:hypothetical protein